jgi:hypothetical protein
MFSLDDFAWYSDRIMTKRKLKKLNIHDTGITGEVQPSDRIYKNNTHWYLLSKRPVPFWLSKRYNIIKHGRLNYL